MHVTSSYSAPCSGPGMRPSAPGYPNRTTKSPKATQRRGQICRLGSVCPPSLKHISERLLEFCTTSIRAFRGQLVSRFLLICSPAQAGHSLCPWGCSESILDCVRTRWTDTLKTNVRPQRPANRGSPVADQGTSCGCASRCEHAFLSMALHGQKASLWGSQGKWVH